MRADIHDGPEQRSNQRPDTLMQDRIARIDETSCTEWPDHTTGSCPEMLMMSKSGPVLLEIAELRRRRPPPGSILPPVDGPVRSSAPVDSNWKPASIFLAAIFCQGRKVDLVSTSPISSSILSKSWVCLSQDFLGTLKIFVAYLISKAIGFSRYVAKLWSLHHIPGYRIS